MTRHAVWFAILLGTLSGSSAFGSPQPRPGGSEETEAFYRGKTITWVVSAEPGGGTDVLTRIMVPFLAKETGAKVVVKNMTGGSLEGDNWTYAEGPRDGLTLLTEGTMPLLLNDLLRSPGAQYVTEKFNFLTGVAPELTVLAVSPKMQEKSLAGLRKAKGLKIGASSSRGYIANAGAVTAEILNLDARVVTGYKGMKSVLLAVAQGEMDAIVSSETEISIAAKSGDVVPLFVVGEERSSLLPNLPTLKEIGVAVPRELADAYRTITTNSRAFLLPPGVPEDKVNHLRRVFRKLNDTKEVEEALARWAGVWRPFIPGEKLQEDVNAIKANKALAAQMEGILKKYSASK
ncbi:MAG: hypothetical protein HY900_25945 [Deltaproteobacteria bacterium]|nr:hypothetical protein [Deltaproteobacteria bacterium]